MPLSSMLGRILLAFGVLIAVAVSAMPAGAAPACTIRGTQGNDVLLGTPGPDVICGRAGNDVLRGLGGDDVLQGGEGDDTLEGGAGHDDLMGQEGLDTVSYADRSAGVTAVLGRVDGHDSDGNAFSAGNGASGESDRIFSGVENLRGGAGADVLRGDAAANALEGGAGDDTLAGGAAADGLRGGAGNDALAGDDGDDTFTAEATPDGADIVDGGGENDLISYAARVEALTLTLAGGADDGASGEGDDLRNVEAATAGAGADTLIGSDAANKLTGSGGADTLQGGGGPDLMLGGAGDDALRARDGGRDTLVQCGTGTDSASIDVVDPAPVECETVSTRPVADLSLALSDAPDPARLTQTVEYRFTVRNAGPEPATGVVVATTLPAGATAAPAAGCSTAGQVVTCALGTLPVGGSVEGVLSVRHGSTGTHTVTSTVDSEADDPQPGDDTATATTTVTDPLADVSVSLSDSPDPVAAPGTDVTYTAEVTNHGPDTAQGAFVTFDVPAGGVAAGCTAVAGGRRCELGDVAAGGSRTASITVRWSTEGAFEVTARAGSATADPNAGNDSDSESTTVGGADLSVSISADRDSAVAGEAGPLYTVAVSNAGPQTAEDVSFTVLVPGWVGVVRHSAGLHGRFRSDADDVHGRVDPGRRLGLAQL